MKYKEVREILEELVRAVVEKQVEADLDITEERVDVTVRPWRPLKMSCPYGRGGGEVDG